MKRKILALGTGFILVASIQVQTFAACSHTYKYLGSYIKQYSRENCKNPFHYSPMTAGGYTDCDVVRYARYKLSKCTKCGQRIHVYDGIVKTEHEKVYHYN